MSALPPSTSEQVRIHARERPGAIALIADGREIDYATFHRDLRKFAAALRRFGLPRLSVVAVACDEIYVHWLTLLACENLGLTTISVLPADRKGLLALLGRIELVLTTHDMSLEGVRCHLMTPAWLDGVFASSEQDAGSTSGDTPLEPADLQRMRRTSGTTGAPKTMVATRALTELRLKSNGPVLGLTSRSRLLISMHFTVQYMYTYATLCLRLGGACVEAGNNLAAAVAQYRPTHVRLFQYQLRSLLDNLPKNFSKPADLTVILGAAPLSGTLRKEVVERLASRLVYQYGINETGTIASIDEKGVATLYSGVEAQVIDARGGPVAPGHEGRLKIRTALLVDGYLDNPEATAQAFRDGWFHTEDAAMMLPGGQLKLLGRGDDMLNVGGVKLEPSTLEESVSRAIPVVDVAATSVANADGIEEICIAVVLKDPSKLREYSARIAHCVPQDCGQVHIRAIPGIPRTVETGKVRRGELKKVFSGKP